MSNARRHGVVSGCDRVKRFGFIILDNEPVCLFVGGHALRSSGIETLLKGDRVTFEVVTARNGRPECVAIERLTSRGS
jgi:cold shock CspA family protein